MTNQPLGLDRAQYAPALQHAFLDIVGKPASRAMPHGLAPSDLNPLDPSALVHAPYVLVSGGQYLGRSNTPSWLKDRPDGYSTVIGDSGGFQFITKPFSYEASCRESLEWLEAHADIGITLDIPTRAIGPYAKGRATGQFPTFADALATSLDNNRFFAANRGGAVPYLTTLQGRDRKEIRAWYDAVKNEPFEGWAFGGATRQLARLVEVIGWLLRDGKLNDRQRHIHVLGTSTAKAAVLLTAVQNALRARPGLSELRITFDTATPSHLMSYNKVAGPLRASPQGLVVSSHVAPCNGVYIGSTKPFPFAESAIGKRITLGDLCVEGSYSAGTAWDTLSGAMMVNHSIDRMLTAFEQANRLAELAPGSYSLIGKGGIRADYMPASLSADLTTVTQILSASDPVAEFARRGTHLTGWTVGVDEVEFDDPDR
ncbi:hypothetical protein [Caulobacter sp. X]|jgi:hypothetical protein|uniref:hypothetical protein n=1 Tax=Caulobacter sp. X TaxID=2048901 RepID=UPI000C14BEF0|nr:hypothetical protein [Caulobacter sp. X]PIB96278.1 hypothetical protein CSW60_17255 [Caulobacter sp. X]